MGFLRETSLYFLSTLPVMVGSAISPGLKTIADEFSSVPNVDFLSKMSLSFPAFAFAISALLIGYLIDKIGRKPVLITSLIIYIVAGSIGFYVHNLYVILVGRVFIGIAAAGVMTTIITLIGDYYTGEKRNRVLGFQVAFGALGAVAYTLIGSALSDVNWNYPFLLFFFPVLLIPSTIFLLPEPTKQDLEDNDALCETPELNNNGNKTFNPKLIIAVCYFLIFVTMFIFYVGTAQVSFYIKEDIDPTISDLKIGIAIALVMLAAAIMGAFYKFFKKLFNFFTLFIAGFSLLGTGFVIISYAGTYTSYNMILIAAVIGGLGTGLILPNFNLYLCNVTTSKNRGKIISGYNALWYIGEALSPIVFEPIIRNTSYSTAFLIGGIVYFSVLIIPIILLVISLANKRNNQLVQVD
jgi:MFS family permease